MTADVVFDKRSHDAPDSTRGNDEPSAPFSRSNQQPLGSIEGVQSPGSLTTQPSIVNVAEQPGPILPLGLTPIVHSKALASRGCGATHAPGMCVVPDGNRIVSVAPQVTPLIGYGSPPAIIPEGFGLIPLGTDLSQCVIISLEQELVTDSALLHESNPYALTESSLKYIRDNPQDRNISDPDRFDFREGTTGSGSHHAKWTTSTSGYLFRLLQLVETKAPEECIWRQVWSEDEVFEAWGIVGNRIDDADMPSVMGRSPKKRGDCDWPEQVPYYLKTTKSSVIDTHQYEIDKSLSFWIRRVAMLEIQVTHHWDKEFMSPEMMRLPYIVEWMNWESDRYRVPPPAYPGSQKVTALTELNRLRKSGNGLLSLTMSTSSKSSKGYRGACKP